MNNISTAPLTLIVNSKISQPINIDTPSYSAKSIDDFTIEFTSKFNNFNIVNRDTIPKMNFALDTEYSSILPILNSLKVGPNVKLYVTFIDSDHNIFIALLNQNFNVGGNIRLGNVLPIPTYVLNNNTYPILYILRSFGFISSDKIALAQISVYLPSSNLQVSFGSIRNGNIIFKLSSQPETILNPITVNGMSFESKDDTIIISCPNNNQEYLTLDNTNNPTSTYGFLLDSDSTSILPYITSINMTQNMQITLIFLGAQNTYQILNINKLPKQESTPSMYICSKNYDPVTFKIASLKRFISGPKLQTYTLVGMKINISDDFDFGMFPDPASYIK